MQRFNDAPPDSWYPVMQPAAAAGRVVESGSSVAGFAGFGPSPTVSTAVAGASGRFIAEGLQALQQPWQAAQLQPATEPAIAGAAPFAAADFMPTAAPAAETLLQQGEMMPPPPPLLPPPAAAAAAPGSLLQQPSPLIGTPGSLAGRRAISLPSQPYQVQQQQLSASGIFATPATLQSPQSWPVAAAAAVAAGAAPAVGSPLSPLSSHGFLQPQIAGQMQAPIKPRVRRKSSSRGHTRKNSIHASGADAAANDGEQEGEQLIQALEMHMVSHGVDQAVLQEQERLKRLVEQHNKRVAAMQMNE